MPVQWGVYLSLSVNVNASRSHSRTAAAVLLLRGDKHEQFINMCMRV